MKKAIIAMSGGVDSSVAALLTKESGDECIGATMKLYNNEDIGVHREKTCCSLDDVEDARSVAIRWICLTTYLILPQISIQKLWIVLWRPTKTDAHPIHVSTVTVI